MSHHGQDLLFHRYVWIGIQGRNLGLAGPFQKDEQQVSAEQIVVIAKVGMRQDPINANRFGGIAAILKRATNVHLGATLRKTLCAVSRREQDIGPNQRRTAIFTIGIGKERKLSKLGNVAIDNVRLIYVNNGIIVANVATGVVTFAQ
jgi:hypothetical protein